MKQINSKIFSFQFFLSDNKKVKSLENGAKQYGGATRYNNGIYSNIPNSDFIIVNEKNNKISIFIPSTIDTDKKIDNKKYVEYSVSYLQSYFTNNNLITYKTHGSWYSDDLQKVVIEDITIITLDIETVTEDIIQLFVLLAKYIKRELKQEGVSIAINTALAIV